MKFLICVCLPALLIGLFSQSASVFVSIFVLLAGLYWLFADEFDPKQEQPSRTPPTAKNLAQRVRQLEQQVADLQTRLAQLERGQAAENFISQDSHSPAETQTFRQPENTLAAENFISQDSHSPAETQIFRQPENALAAENSISQDSHSQNETENFRQPENHIAAKSPIRVVRPKPAPTPREPNPIMAWFAKGNPLLKTGVVVLFLGLAFLLNYVSSYIPIQLKYLAVFGTGAAAAVGGVKLGARKRDYGLVLQGFGFAVMYLTSLSAWKWHGLVPAGVVFVVMVALVAAMVWQAVRQDARVLAQVAVLGGVAAPVLTADENGSFLILFTYLAIMNTGVAVVAWFKAWRSLNLIGFVGTFLIGAAWGADAYRPAHFAQTEPFLLYHWLLYTLIACFFAQRTLADKAFSGSLNTLPNHASLAQIVASVWASGRQIGGLDGTLLFGTALMAFGLQYQMVNEWAYGAAWSALGFALVYAVFAYYFVRENNEHLDVMKQAFSMLSFIFITLTILFALEGQWTATAWALEAALVYHFGLKQKQPYTRLCAVGVYLLAAVAQFGSLKLGTETLLSGSLIGTFLAMAGGAWMYYAWHATWRKESAEWEAYCQSWILVISLIHALTLPMLAFAVLGSMLALSAYALVFAALQFKQQNTVLSVFSLVSGGFACVLAIFNHGMIAPSMMIYCALAWLASAFCLHQAIWQDEDKPDFLNALFAWALLAVGCCVLVYHVDKLFNLNNNLYEFLIVAVPLAVWAQYTRWREGLQAATMMGLLMCFMIWMESSQWVQGNLWAGSLQLMGATILLVALLLCLRSLTAHYVVFTVLMITWTWFVGQLGAAHWLGVWAQLAWLLVPMAAWVAIYVWRHESYLKKYAAVYWDSGSLILAMYAVSWLLWANWVTPKTAGWAYLPLLNPLELATAAIIAQLMCWLRAWLPKNAEGRSLALNLPFALAWFSVSAAVMRVWHIYLDVEWRLPNLLASFGLQASLSIVWACVAIALMVRGNQKGWRNLWLVGASLMGVVVLKLFFVELGNSGGMARIVSFIVVGLLLLLVGWFAPAPPRKQD